jgi:hypothetical protein
VSALDSPAIQEGHRAGLPEAKNICRTNTPNICDDFIFDEPETHQSTGAGEIALSVATSA